MDGRGYTNRANTAKDWIGYDPYGFRQNKHEAVVKEGASLSDIVAQCNLSADPASPIQVAAPTTEKDVVNDYIHFIWLGERDIAAKAKGKENILSWKKQNPEKTIIVWTNTVDPCTGLPFSKEVLDERTEWCKKNNVVLLNVDDVFAGRMKLEAAYQRELQKPNFGAASDILRWYILKLFGGVYADIDIACAEPLGIMTAPMGLKINAASRNVSDEFTRLFVNHTSATMNDLIMAVKNCQEIDDVLAAIEKAYLSKPADLFKYGFEISSYDDRKSYEVAMPTIRSKDLYRQLTIARSGPAVLCHLYGSREREVTEKMGADFIIDPDKFIYQSGQTWLEPESTKIRARNTADIVKQVYSNIVADLQLDDGRVLRLDNYAKTIKQHNLAGSLLQQLAKDFPDLANKIQYAHFDECLNPDDAASATFINTLFNREYFPNLSREPKFYLGNSQFIELLNKEGIDLTKAKLLPYMVANCDEFEAYKPVIAYYIKNKIPLTSDGKSLLELAMTYRGYAHGNPAAVGALLQAGVKSGANEGLRATECETLAHWAAEYCRDVPSLKIIIDFCIENNLQLNKPNINNLTPVGVLEKSYNNLHFPETKNMLDFLKATIDNHPDNKQQACNIS